jgi:hypothetical protein
MDFQGLLAVYLCSDTISSDYDFRRTLYFEKPPGATNAVAGLQKRAMATGTRDLSSRLMMFSIPQASVARLRFRATITGEARMNTC